MIKEYMYIYRAYKCKCGWIACELKKLYMMIIFYEVSVVLLTVNATGSSIIAFEQSRSFGGLNSMCKVKTNSKLLMK